MRRQSYRMGLVCMGLAIGVVLAGVAWAQDAKPAQTLIRICGADAMVTLMTKCSEEYQKTHPDVKFEVSGGGAGLGVKQALAGKVELGMVSRQLEGDETTLGAFVPVAKDAVFVTASAANPAAPALAAKGMNKKVLSGLWLAGKTMTWADVVGGDCKEPIKIFTREDACGAAEVWAKFLGATQPDLKGTPVKGDKGVAEAVKAAPTGLGYNNLATAYDLVKGKPIEGLVVVAFDANDNGKIDLSEDISTPAKAIKAIADGIYPTPPARTLHLLTKKEFTGATKEFVVWMLTEGQKAAAAAGYITLSETEAKGAQGKLTK